MEKRNHTVKESRQFAKGNLTWEKKSDWKKEMILGAGSGIFEKEICSAERKENEKGSRCY